MSRCAGPLLGQRTGMEAARPSLLADREASRSLAASRPSQVYSTGSLRFRESHVIVFKERVCALVVSQPRSQPELYCATCPSSFFMPCISRSLPHLALLMHRDGMCGISPKAHVDHESVTRWDGEWSCMQACYAHTCANP